MFDPARTLLLSDLGLASFVKSESIQLFLIETMTKPITPYCASKFAIEGLTQSLAKELPPQMAAVALDPGGSIDTSMLRSCAPDEVEHAPSPEAWARVSVPYMTNLAPLDSGRSTTDGTIWVVRGVDLLMKNWFSLGGLLVGLIGSVVSITVCYDFIFGESLKGLDILLFLMIMLPAIFAFITSFVPVPLILIACIWSLPLSLYVWIASDVKWFAISCFTYLFSSYLKFYGSQNRIHETGS